MTTVEEQQLIRRYLAGESVRGLARDFGITLQTIYNILRRNNVPQRSQTRASKAETLVKACHEGAIAASAARQLGLSESAATRAIRKYRKEGATVEIKKGRPTLARSQLSIGVSPTLTVVALSQIPFPYPQISAEKFGRELSRLKAFVSRTEAGEIRPRSPVGVHLCATFFPNRYKARSGSLISAFDAWQNETMMRKAIEFQIKHGDPTTPERVLRAITLFCRTPSIFRPAVAKFIYERYCAKGGRVWDPCSGFGGRLLGAAAAGIQYVGTDVDTATVEGNRELARAIGASADVHLCPAEIFNPPSVDLVFTSPPYFDRERYSQEESQSWRRHGASLDTWVEGFLRPVIERAWRALTTNGHLVLNIADLRKGSKTIPLVTKTIDAAVAVGFLHSETLQMPLNAVNRKAPTEPVLVFTKR